MGYQKQNTRFKINKNLFSQDGGMFDNGNVNWCMLGGHFCVELGIFVSNRAFLCRTMHFAVEPGFFVSNEYYKWT